MTPASHGRRRLLGLIACLALPALASPAAHAQAGGGVPVMDAPSAHGLSGAGGLLVDIRTPAELATTGKPGGAVAIALQDDERRFRNSFAQEVATAAGGDRNRPIALLDANGRRSQFAARLLASQGFAQVFVVGEGILGSNLGPGWLARGLPIEK